jgi:hypothetical protein
MEKLDDERPFKPATAWRGVTMMPFWNSKRRLQTQMSHCVLRDNRLKIRLVLFLLLVVCGKAWALDEFEGTKCGADIPKSLVGKRGSNERAGVLEGRHKDLGLKDLGGTEISDGLFLASWQICGSEYELLVNVKNGIIRDVLPFPPHSATSPMFIGACQADGKKIPGTVVAVLNNSARSDARDAKLAGIMLKATAAWKIDAAKEKFAKQSTGTLACPLDGIVTQDGGP